MDRIGRSWTPEVERIVAETAAFARQFGVEHHSSSRESLVANTSSSGTGSDAELNDHSPGTSRFIFATGVENPKEVVIYARSIGDAKASARKLYAAAELRRIQHIVG